MPRARVAAGILAMLLSVDAVADIFVGVTPCGPPIREFLRIPPKAPCEFVRWDVWPALGVNGHPSRLRVTAEYGVEGKAARRIQREGNWAVDRGTPEHPDGRLLWIELRGREMRLWNVGPHTVHFLDEHRNLLVGDARHGYMLATAFSESPRQDGPPLELHFTPVPEANGPLSLVERPVPDPRAGEVRIRVEACGVCHSDAFAKTGSYPGIPYPIVPGHEVAGTIDAVGAGVSDWRVGQRVGVGWHGGHCNRCAACRRGSFIDCANHRIPGINMDGGYADYMIAPVEGLAAMPDELKAQEAAPLLCAGAVGYRALRLCNLQDGQSLGLMGFGGSNHIVLKVAQYKYPNSRIFVFTRNPSEREFARSLGAAWAGAIDEVPPEALDAILDTTPVWKPIIEGLKRLKPGGRLVINAI